MKDSASKAHLAELKQERQRLAALDYLQGLTLEVTEKPRSSPCAPPQYIGRLQRVDQAAFEDGKTVHWVPMTEVKEYQKRIQIGDKITQLEQQIQQIETPV